MAHEDPFIESANDFGEKCPWCGATLDDKTTVDTEGAMGYSAYFFRTRFSCRVCPYWLRTRYGRFNELARVERMPDPLEQRVRLDQAHSIMRQLMPNGVDSYEAGRVWMLDERTVCKNVGTFEVRSLHGLLAFLAAGYSKTGREDLARRALELAVEELAPIDPAEWRLLVEDPEEVNEVGWILQTLTAIYRKQGRAAGEQLDRLGRQFEQARRERAQRPSEN